MKINTLLQKIGLSEKESLIYLSLLDWGPQTISSLSRHTGLHRPALYKILPAVLQKGLITESVKGKRRLYNAESPEKLRLLFEELLHEFQDILPELLHQHDTAGSKPIVKFLTGRKGIIFVYEDLLTTLKKGDIFYRYSSAGESRKQNWYVPKNYQERRDAKQLERFVITNKRTAQRKKKRLERDIKIVPPNYDLFEYDITMLIYGYKIAFIDYNTETAVIIENKIIAEFQKKIFKLLYQKL